MRFAVLSLVLLVASTASAQETASSDTADTSATTDDTSTSTEAAPPTGNDSQGEDVVTSLGNAIGEPSFTATEDMMPRASQRRLAWREEWPRYSFDEAVLSVGLGLFVVAAELLPTATSHPNWTDVNALDGAVHDGLRLNLADQRDSARIAGDVLMWIDLGIPYVIDALFAAGIGDGSWDTALQMGLISLEANIISLVVWRLTSLLARRERPVVHDCMNPSTTDPLRNPSALECANPQPTQSFPSNTSVNAFTGAALTCLHHTTMSVFGDEGADATACVGALTIASVAGLLRVMSNLEYLTDVVTGAAIGLVAGWLLPWLLHYQGGARPELRPPVAAIPVPMFGAGNTVGLDVVGWF